MVEGGNESSYDEKGVHLHFGYHREHMSPLGGLAEKKLELISEGSYSSHTHTHTPPPSSKLTGAERSRAEKREA